MSLAKYDGYKDSGIEWLDDIPEHWSINRNKNVFREISKLSKSGNETLLTVSHITGVTPRSEKNVNMFFAETMEGYKICQEGDLVINTMWAWMGALGTSRFHGICSPAYNVYRNINGIDYCHQYFDYLFRTPNFIVEMTRLSKGIVESRLRLYPKDFFRIQTPLPPLPEQTSIANYLDLKTSAIDRKVALLEQKITHYHQLRKSLINETVCRGLDKNAKFKDSGIEWIGMIPEHWEVKRLKDIFKLFNGYGFSIDEQGSENGEVPFYKVSDINGLGKYITKSNNYVSKKTCLNNGWKLIPAYSIITAKIGEALKKNHRKVNKTKCLIDNNCVALITKEVVDYAFWLVAIIDFSIFDNMGTVPSISTKHFNTFEIVLPSIYEQNIIAHYLDEKTHKIDSIVNNIKSQIEILKELRKTLINDVVTGKIKVTV